MELTTSRHRVDQCFTSSPPLWRKRWHQVVNWLNRRHGMVDKPAFQWGKTEWYTGGDEARWLKP